MNYAIRNKSNGLYLGTTQTQEGYYQSWNLQGDAVISFNTEHDASTFSNFQGYDMLSGVPFEIVPFPVASSKLNIVRNISISGVFVLLLLSGFAEKNYTNALNASALSFGSDSDIIDTMKVYGFEGVDPLSDVEPTMYDKVVALFGSKF